MVLLYAGGRSFKLIPLWLMVKAKENLTGDVDSGICKGRITMLDLFPDDFFKSRMSLNAI